MSQRQQAREQRKQSFWDARYEAAEQRGGRSVAWVAFNQLGAAVVGRPVGERNQAWRWAADQMIRLAKAITAGDFHSGASQPNLTLRRLPTRPDALRARARRQV